MDKATEWYEAELDKAYARIESLERELAEERALTDRAADRVSRWLGFDDGDGGDAAFMDEYRKARGL